MPTLHRERQKIKDKGGSGKTQQPDSTPPSPVDTDLTWILLTALQSYTHTLLLLHYQLQFSYFLQFPLQLLQQTAARSSNDNAPALNPMTI